MTDTERQALGVYLLSPELAQASILTEDHFEAERHRALFVLLKSKAWTDGQELFVHLSEKPRVAEKVGGLPYAMSHMDEAPSTQNVGTYEDALKRKRARSLLAAAAVEAQALSFDGAEPFELVKAVRDRLDAIDIDRRGVVVSATEGAQDVADDLEEEVRGERVPYMTTGWREWDTRWVGIPSEGVLLFLARSGMGKTSLVNSLAVAMAMSGHKVHIHGTETSANKRNRAIIFGIAGISPRQWGHLTLRHSEGRCNGEQLATLRECHRRLLAAADIRAGLPITVTGSGLSCERLCSEVRNQARKGLAVAFVDYVQDFPFSSGIEGKRTSQIVHHSRMLKDLSAEIRKPLVAAAQVSGEKEGIPSKGQVVPQMWDAQWASGLHQDAEEVYAINRGDYWEQRLTDVDGNVSAMFSEDRFGQVGVIDIHARKRREGSLGHLALDWDGPRRWVGPVFEEMERKRAINNTPQPSWHDAGPMDVGCATVRKEVTT